MIIAKIIAFVLHLIGKGATTLPGKIALNIKYDLLNYLSKGVHIVCVTGTNGKTTTCALIEQAIKNSGYAYFINKSGANMITGVSTAFIMNSNIFGKCKKEYAILECDENSFPIISRYLDAEIVVVTNIFRDQLDRYGEIDNTMNKIVKAIENMPDATVVLNADCPITYYISQCISNKIVAFGINDNLNINAVSDVNYCPKCSSILSYNTKIYAQLGDFYCSSCGYSRVKPTISCDKIIDINEDGSSFVMNNKIINTNLGGIYNIYNYLSATCVLNYYNINNYDSMNTFDGAFGRMEHFKFNDNDILLLLVKNPVGFSNCISYAKNIKGNLLQVFALNDNDADGRDISWIWDVDFSCINDSAIAIGKRAYDMALRLKYDNVSIQKIFDGERYQDLIDYIKSSNQDVVIFSSYTAMMNMRPHFIKEFGGSQFWE